MAKQTPNTENIRENLQDSSFNGVAKGISQLHNIYHTLEYRDLFGKDGSLASEVSSDLEDAARSGEFDPLLINLLSFPNRAISFEAGHDLCHSPTGLRSLAAFWELSEQELGRLIEENDGSIGALHQLQNLTFECSPKAERSLESMYPLHKEKKGAQISETISDISSRLQRISQLWPKAPDCTGIFCELLTERISFLPSISVSRFNAEAFNLILESLEAENNDGVHTNPQIVTGDMARRMLRALPKLNKVAFGERKGSVARKYGHELLNHILDVSRQSRKRNDEKSIE